MSTYANQMKQEWARLIDQANMSGNDELRQQYIKLRDAGVEPGQVIANPMVFDGGYSYNPGGGRLSYGSREDGDYWSYDANQKRTHYGGMTFDGYYDHGLLSKITEDDWAGATDRFAKDYEDRLASLDSGTQLKYLQELKRFGGLDNMAVNLNDDRFFEKIGYDKSYGDIHQQNQQNILMDAYQQAWQRENPGQEWQMGMQNTPHGIMKDIYNMDWTEHFGTQKDAGHIAKMNDRNAMMAEINKIYQGPQQGYVRDKAVADIYQRYGADLPSNLARFGAPAQVHPAIQPKQSTSHLPPSYAQPSAPAAPQQPAAPSQPTAPGSDTASNFGDFDWGSLYEQMSNYFTSQQQPQTQSAPREQIGSFQQYGPTIAARKQSYVSSTPYSGKGS